MLRSDLFDYSNAINNNKTTASKSFKYKTKIKGSTPDNAINSRSCCSLKLFK